MTEIIEALYQKHIKSLPHSEQLRLIERIAAGAAQQEEVGQKPSRTIMELHGKGAKVWKNVDVNAYVEDLRTEWNDRP